MKRGKPLTLSQSLTVIKAVDMDDDEMIGKDDLCSYCMSNRQLPIVYESYTIGIADF